MCVCVCVCVCARARARARVTIRMKCRTNGKQDKRHHRYFKLEASVSKAILKHDKKSEKTLPVQRIHEAVVDIENVSWKISSS